MNAIAPPPGQRLRIALIVLAALTVLLLAYVAAGPYLAIHGIRQALATQDVAALQRQGLRWRLTDIRFGRP